MLRLAKYLKPYLLLILLAIALLFVQANADLALPDYTARIVNTGIQLSGVESAIPQAVRQSTLEKWALFMSAQDKASVLTDYTLVNKDSSNYQKMVAKYPALANEPIYVLNKIDQAETDRINPVMGKAILAFSFIQQTMDNPSQAAPMMQSFGFDLSKSAAGQAGAGTANQAQAIKTLMAALNDEYTALGMDPNTIAAMLSKGIPIPMAIRQSSMDKLSLFMSPQDKASVLSNYTLVDKTSPNYDQYVKDYPALANTPVYVLNQVDQASLKTLTPIMAKSFMVVSLFQQILTDPTQAAATLQSMGIDLSQLSAGNTTTGALSSTMITAAAAGPIKSEYTALGIDTTKFELYYLLRVGGIMLALTLLSGICTTAVSFLAARTAAGVGRDVRKDQFAKVESFSSTEFEKFSTASLITRSTNDITQVQLVVFMIMRMVLYAPIIGIGAIIHAFRLDTSMWWIIALAVGVLLTIIIAVFTVALPRFRIIQKLTDRLNLVMRENLAGMMVIRAFNRQEFEENRFNKANLDITAVQLFINRIMVIMMPLMMLIMSGVSVLIIWIGSHQVQQANMQVGDVIAFMQYTTQVVFAFLMMSMMFIILPQASVSAGRIADVLEVEPVIKDPAEPKHFNDQFVGSVEFRNVSFRYPDAEEDVLHDISFVAKPGQTTALIGSTGSGKSTVVNLIPRFYDVTSGSILVDNMDIRQLNQHDLRQKIGYIPQKGVLFSGTIESNLRYADENAGDDVLREAAEIAQATEFILGNENGDHDGNGYHTGDGKNGGSQGSSQRGIQGSSQDGSRDGSEAQNGDGNSSGEGFQAEISQGGTNVSGGQKQRLSIARALVKKPPIYIFDDSFSAVDFKTDAALRRALKQKTAASTILIVTQRVSTIKNAEQIIVLDEGKIIGKGTHQELMRDCKEYQEIALSQLSQEELL